MGELHWEFYGLGSGWAGSQPLNFFLTWNPGLHPGLAYRRAFDAWRLCVLKECGSTEDRNEELDSHLGTLVADADGFAVWGHVEVSDGGWDTEGYGKDEAGREQVAAVERESGGEASDEA